MTTRFMHREKLDQILQFVFLGGSCLVMNGLLFKGEKRFIEVSDCSGHSDIESVESGSNQWGLQIFRVSEERFISFLNIRSG